MAMCITISKSFNRGGGLSSGGKRNNIGENSVCIKLYGY